MNSYISAIGTACPEHTTPQLEIADFMANAMQLTGHERIRLQALYRASGIKSRSSVLQDYSLGKGGFNFYANTHDMEPFPTVEKRMKVYKKEAIKLALEATKNCLAKLPRFRKNSITHLITVSCTGLYAPGVDIELIEELDLPYNIQRSAINFMGCYAAFNALKIADAICKADAFSNVLIVCVELCTLHFQKKKDDDNILANALFGDGAAAMLLTPAPISGVSLSLKKFYCTLAFEGKQEMAWRIGDFGFEMKLSSYVPDVIRTGIKSLTDNLLRHLELTLDQIDLYAIHPGGKRILETIEKELGLTKEDNKYAYQVLKKHGNMSSATVVFVLEEILDNLALTGHGKKILSFAFGPGLTLESMVLEINVRK